MYVRKDGQVVRGWRSLVANPLHATGKLFQWLYGLLVAFFLSLVQPTWSAQKQSRPSASSSAATKTGKEKTPSPGTRANPRFRTLSDLKRSEGASSCASGHCG